VLTPFTRVNSDVDVVKVNGTVCRFEGKKIYVMLNKPRGYVCTSKDKFADKLALDLIDVPERLFSVGRLDKDSEGLILFTNDGDFAQRIGHPSYSVRKKYYVTIDGSFSREDGLTLEKGIVDEGERLKAVSVKPLKKSKRSDRQVLEFVLNEGKNREIRRMCRHLGWHVKRLERVEIGSLTLGKLATGSWRELTAKEVAQF
jgi:pseudouridine synthase